MKHSKLSKDPPVSVNNPGLNFFFYSERRGGEGIRDIKLDIDLVVELYLV